MQPSHLQSPIIAVQVQVGVYNEAALQRFDLVLSEAAKNGIKVIFPLVNGDNFLGGPQWYFDQACRACFRQAHLLLRIKTCLIENLL